MRLATNALLCFSLLLFHLWRCWRPVISGKGVLNQKSELQKAMQKHREVQSRKEMEKERLSTRSALEVTLEKRARRLEEVFKFFFFTDSTISSASNDH